MLAPSSSTAAEGGGALGRGGGSGVAAAFFRVGSAALELEPSRSAAGSCTPREAAVEKGYGGQDQGGSRSSLARLLSDACEREIVAVSAAAGECSGAAGPPRTTDWAEPMRCVMLKEAARLWTREALFCSVLAGFPPPASSSGRESHSDGRHSPVPEIERRLRTCLASSSYEVRAAAAKSVDGLFEELLAQASCVVTGGPPPPGSAGASSNTPSRPSGLEEVSALLPSTVAAAAMPSSSSLGSGKAVSQLAFLLLSNRLAAELCSRLEIVLWGHLADGRESVAKVRGRALRVLSKLQAVEEAITRGGTGLDLKRDRRPAPSEGVEEVARGCRETDRIVDMSRRLLDDARGDEPRAAALQCLGRALGRGLQRICGAVAAAVEEEEDAMSAAGTSSASPPPLDDAAEVFLDSVSEMSHPDQSERCRAAAVASLAASGLLQLLDANHSAADRRVSGGSSRPDGSIVRLRAEALALRGWLIALRLLEDEDADVRDSAAALATRSSPPRGGSGPRAQQQGTGAEEAGAHLRPVHGGLFVEVVLRQVVELLGRAASQRGAAGQSVREALQALVMDPEEELPALLQPTVSMCD